MKIDEPRYKWAGQLTNRRRTDAVVLHHAQAATASAQDIHRWHLNNGWAGIGYHYVVRKDGTVQRGRPEQVIGAHAGSRNDYNSRSIGICFEGDFMRERMGEKQLAAGRELLRDIMRRYGPLVILTHRDVTATDCPGKLFPVEELKNYEEEETMKVYTKVEEMPDWAQPTFRKLIAIGVVAMDKQGKISVQESSLQPMVYADRLGLIK